MVDMILLVLLIICVFIAGVATYQMKKKLRECIDRELPDAAEAYIMARMNTIKITVYAIGAIGIGKIVLTIMQR